MKLCPRCKTNPLDSDFGWCSICKKEYNKVYLENYRKNNPDKIKAENRSQYLKNRAGRLKYQGEHRRVNRIEIKAKLISLTDYKRQLLTEIKNRPCADCGHTFPAVAMDFDHVRGEKKYNLANAANSGLSIETMLKEVAKCEVVCSCCHRVRTSERVSDKRVAKSSGSI